MRHASRFEFRLDRLLTIRERRERVAAGAFAAATAKADALAHEREHVIGIRAHARDAILPQAGATSIAGTLQNAAVIVAHLDAELARLDTLIADASQKRELCKAALTVCARERRVLERLRGRRLKAWRVEDTRRARAVLDEFAQRRTHRAFASSLHTSS